MRVAVYGASGHTARFVVAELLRRGHSPIAIGRDRSRTEAAAARYDAEVETRIARLDEPGALDRALADTDAVIHCAGPFLDTARPLIEAALRARVHYFDLAAEQASALATFASFDVRARERGVLIVPAAGFYGGLGDLLATGAMRGWSQADRVEIAIALDRWLPTRGTRSTGERNTYARLVLSGGRLEEMQPSAPVQWRFPRPFGTQTAVELPFTETILIARHLRVHDVRSYLNEIPLRDLADPATPGPVAADEQGRSDQRFVVEVAVRKGGEERRIRASGRDIYAVTAPIAVEIIGRACSDPSRKAGAFAPGQLVDAGEVLKTLERRSEIALTKGCYRACAAGARRVWFSTLQVRPRRPHASSRLR